MDIVKRYTIQIGQPTAAHITLAGCGGTGSFLALHLARLAYHAKGKGIDVQLTFVDPDSVEPKNLGRQNFCHAEVGTPKAAALATRYSAAFGLPIAFHVARVGDAKIDANRSRFDLVIGAVDNAAARQSIHDAVQSYTGKLWWLDTGNHEHAGQVLLGNRVDLRASVISPLGFATDLPAPSVQHPELLQAPTMDVVQSEASCADLIARDAQSLMVNQAAAGWAAVYVARLLLSHDLDLMATYFDLVTGSARSVPITEPGISREISDKETVD